MSAHLCDSLLYGHLWSTPELHELLDDEGRIGAWLDILTALALAQADSGIIPADAARQIAEHARPERIDLRELATETRATGHSTLGLIRCLRHRLPAPAREWVYYGATVQDLSDTWHALIARQVMAIADRELAALVDSCADLARRHRDTVMCGRTHGQPGQPVTFGFKAAVWASELARHRTRLAEAAERIQVVQLGGALGTMEFWGARAERLLARFAERLGLGAPDMAWLTARDRVAEFLNLLALVTATLAKIGQEVYTLQRPEIGELGEPWEPGQVGSITMPHKRNPELSEHLVTLARVVRSNAALGVEGMVHEHERDGRAWKTEWLIVPEACMLTGAALSLARRLLSGLEVHPERMLDNVRERGGYLMSEAVMRTLAERLGKHTAHEVVYEAALAGRRDGVGLRAALLDEARVTEVLSPDEIDDSLDSGRSVAAAGVFVDRVLSSLAAAPGGAGA
ncbi:class-II fumarase/aspartase family protein [Streptomyces sp. HF10]|uniref:class-II fumarase/aspartase family protein n=1 Tax=Streptomyces sp. HF10 TaxID=2692233 RepID=UPI001317897A|nr:adenylosuccinate lyase family protein [Streptomyces sp. HF10]QHC31829.1 adenylosuccinate lyase family protein [Streptomyces sp. HF10]